MKLTWAFILILNLQMSASVWSQTTTMSLKMKNSTLQELFTKIEKGSEYRFFYNNDEVDVNQRISVDVEDKTIGVILETALKGLPYSFKESENKLIVIEKTGELTNPTGVNVQQGKKVTVKVTDSSGGSLPGVSVVLKGTTIGIITDNNGICSLDNIPENAILQFSFVGMKTQDVKVTGKTSMNVKMEEESVGIEEVVAIGYGTQKKVNLTGSVSSVSSNSLTQRATTNPTDLLQGKVPGLRVTQPSGQPGHDDAIFEVRGLGSFGASSSPLVLVDGIVGNLSNLAPNDIETITVLKDAASASIYGSKAANGVILVTTKQAKKGAFIEYQFDCGVQNATRLPERITNSAEYMEMYNSARANAGMSAIFTKEQIDAYKNATDRNEYPNFDWVDYYFKPGKVNNHYLSISNTTDKSAYKFSMNYLNQDGILPNINFKKYNAQLNFTNQINKFIKIGTNINAVFKNNSELAFGDASEAVRFIYILSPLYKPFLPDGSGRKSAWAYASEPGNVNAPVVFDNGSVNYKNYALNAQIYADINLYKGLVWTIKAAVNYADDAAKNHAFATQEHYLYHKEPGKTDYTLVNSVNSHAGGVGVTDTYIKTIIPSIYSVLNYNTKIATDHNLTAMIGFEQQSYKYQYLSGNRKIFPNTNLKELNAGSSEGQTLGGSANEWALRSYFGRLGYDFNGKYLIEANARYDGTSRVAESNRWGFFPSMSAGWRISEEKLIKENFSWVNNLKLRASYGVLGNQEIGNYPYQDILNLTGYPFNGTMEQGALISRFTDKNLRWELTKVSDIGLDMDIKNGLFGLTFDWFKKKTSDILTTLPVPASLGLSGPITNNGELQNVGWEMELRHGKQIGEFRYDVNFIVSTFKNKLLSIVVPTKGINEVGLPFNSFYMYQMEGIFQSQEDIDNSADHIFYTPKPGNIKIKDQNGDKIIDANDRISISPYPDFTYSFGLNVGWKRFNLSAFFQGVEGIKIRISGWGFDPFTEGSPPSVRFRNAWTPTNHSNTIPAIYPGSIASIDNYPSTYHLQDASYLRLKNVNLSYALPKQIVDKLKLQDLSIYVSGDNLLTFTKFPGIDPEMAGSYNRAAQYPQVRILNAGVKLKF